MTNKKKLTVIFIAVICFAIITAATVLLVSYLSEKKADDELKRALKEYYDQKLTLYKSENELYEEFDVDVAFLGDSLTDGYDLGYYYPQYTVVNRGIGGDTSHGLEARLEVSLYDLCPKVAVILIGANNFDTMLDNYESILLGIKDHLPKTKVVLCSLTAMGLGWKKNNRIAAYNNVTIKKLAAKHGFEFVDLYTPLFNVDTGEIFAEYTTDGGHLTDKGYRVLTDEITPYLEKLLDGWQK